MPVRWIVASLIMATMPAAAQTWNGRSAAADSPRARPIVIRDIDHRTVSKSRSRVVLPPAVLPPSAGTRDIIDSARNGERAGQLSGKKARGIRRAARGIRASTGRYGRDGLSHSEAHEIAVRTEALRGLVHAERLNGIMYPERVAAP